MKKLFFKIFVLLFILQSFSSCQFSSLFHRAKKIEVPFQNINSITANGTDKYNIIRDSLSKNISITINNNLINKNHSVEPLFFDSKSGNNLTGFLLTPNINKRDDIIILHFHGSASNLINYHYPLISKLAEKGFQIFTFDYSGYGTSIGKATRKNVLLDAYSALDFIKNNPELKSKKIILFGQSYGGYLASVVGSNKQDFIEGIIIEGAFYSHRKEAIYTSNFLANIVYDGIRAEKEIKKNKKPLLVIHSIEDELVPLRFGRKIYEEANQPKTFMQIDKSHLEGLTFYMDSISNQINIKFR